MQLAELNLRSAVALIDPAVTDDVPLHWQRSKVRSSCLERLSEVVLVGGSQARRPSAE